MIMIIIMKKIDNYCFSLNVFYSANKPLDSLDFTYFLPTTLRLIYITHALDYSHIIDHLVLPGFNQFNSILFVYYRKGILY